MNASPLRSLRGDTTIWFIFFVLIIFSMLAVYSASASLSVRMDGGRYEITLAKHAIHVLLGVALAYGAYRTPHYRFKSLAPWLLGGSIVMLIYTFFYGVELSDARRWLQLPFTSFRFQTSDFAKIGLIVYLARAISAYQDRMQEGKGLMGPLIWPVIIVCGLIAPSDLSTAMMLFATCVVMLFIGRLPMKYIGYFFLAGLVMFAFLIVVGTIAPDYVRLDTWVSRLTTFYNGSDADQVVRSKIAIATGGIFGEGAGMSVQRSFIPTSHADFIYPVIVEEYGLVGSFVVIGLYLWLFIRSCRLLTKSTKLFGAIMAIGLSLLIVMQALANIAVAVNIFPVTGLTLPIISRGGTSLVFSCIAFGIILSVSRVVEQKGKLKRTKTVRTQAV
ncbi:MAG: FtsW/RodA/SpoVE family cell cycle protein [Saprospiraceae bacterium]